MRGQWHLARLKLISPLKNIALPRIDLARETSANKKAPVRWQQLQSRSISRSFRGEEVASRPHGRPSRLDPSCARLCNLREAGLKAARLRRGRRVVTSREW